MSAGQGSAQARRVAAESSARAAPTVAATRAARRAAQGLALKMVLLDPAPDETSDLASLDSILAAGPRHFRPVESKPEDLAVILYTSGTTAEPQGVMLTHDNLLGEIDSVFRYLVVGPTDAILGVLPLFHAEPARWRWIARSAWRAGRRAGSGSRRSSPRWRCRYSPRGRPPAPHAGLIPASSKSRCAPWRHPFRGRRRRWDRSTRR